MNTEVDPETNPLLTGDDANPGADETGEQIEMENLNPYDSSSRRGSVDPTSHHRTYGETSFGGDTTDTTPLIEKESKIDAALEIIQRKFPKFNPANSPFTYIVDEHDRVMGRLKTNKGKYHLLFKADGALNDKLPKTIIKSLGPPAEEIFETNEEKIARRNKKISELREQLATTSDEHVREELNQTIDEEQNAIVQLERANEEIEQRMTLRDRVKTIFKKYGFTV